MPTEKTYWGGGGGVTCHPPCSLWSCLGPKLRRKRQGEEADRAKQTLLA